MGALDRCSAGLPVPACLRVGLPAVRQGQTGAPQRQVSLVVICK